MIDSRDRAYLDMAAALAAKARGRTHPNPHVGAVVVRGGRIVGTGFHAAAGKAHAEAAALLQAGPKAAKSTLYVSLEPCVRWGRTPPCADAIRAAGVARVVISRLDPNPLVNGRGVRRLRRAGLAVDVADPSPAPPRLNEMYSRFIVSGRPFVTLKAAASLDGKLATRTGEARWISSPAAREYAHLVRSEHDAVLVGAATVRTDDPRLTARPPVGKGKPVLRAVLDPGLRLPLKSRLLAARGGPVVIYAGRNASGRKAAALARRGAEIVSVRESKSGLDLEFILDDLGRRGIAGLLVEGGGRTAAGFLDARLVDKVLLILAPSLIGGREAVSLYGGFGAGRLAEAPRLKRASALRLGGDLIVEGYL